jgi:hypothetical protein
MILYIPSVDTREKIVIVNTPAKEDDMISINVSEAEIIIYRNHRQDYWLECEQ